MRFDELSGIDSDDFNKKVAESAFSFADIAHSEATKSKTGSGKGIRVFILGTEYNITKIKYDNDPVFKSGESIGWCLSPSSKIAFCDLDTHPYYADEDPADLRSIEKRIIRHEIIHAFLYESGLGDSSTESESWATNEEMVDWFALQSPKIFKAFEEAGING